MSVATPPLAEFVVCVDPDWFPDGEPGLIHQPCGMCVCTVDHNDELEVLVRTAYDHLESCTESTTTEGAA